MQINVIQDMNKIKDRNHRISSLDTQKAFGKTKYIFMENHLENQVRGIILKKIPQRWKDKHKCFFFLFCGDVIFKSSEICISFRVYIDVGGSLKDVSTQGKEIQKRGNDGKKYVN